MHSHDGSPFGPVGDEKSVVRSRDERSGIAAAQSRLAVLVDSQFIVAEIEYEFKPAGREYPLVRMRTRVAVIQPEVLNEI
jgi:hypothetical protein